MKKNSVKRFVEQFNQAVAQGCVRHSGIKFESLCDAPIISTVLTKIGPITGYSCFGYEEYHHEVASITGWDITSDYAEVNVKLTSARMDMPKDILLDKKSVFGSKRFRMMIRAAR